MDYKFGGQWCLERKITNGCFGEIFKGKNQYTQEEVAIKLEPVASKANQLLQEAKTLKRLDNALGFPKVRWYGYKGGFNVLILDLLGPNLQDLFNSLNKSLSLKSVLMIADQLLSRIQALHSYHYLHRDIKPENILIGRDNFTNLIYLIDFGLSKKFKDSTKKHIKYKEGKGFTGNQRFSSSNSLLGIEQSRRDDLEAIGYVLIYFVKGFLPWENSYNGENGQKKNPLVTSKIQVSIESLCKDCHPAFGLYMNYVKSLAFSTKPDYAYVIRIFRDAFISSDFEYDHAFEWKHMKIFLNNTKSLSPVKTINISESDEIVKDN
ncbi:hypothetical protein SteCoe_12473 [Stentor coeruleus]|uniref:Casein kinase I n=1 Tax=Stentor coeruleus TaxID=5963 RepID=A0A1R2CAV8_9CILI|nr:hypothetical protein SteCoe_12473 [Stentor coeruleus]